MPSAIHQALGFPAEEPAEVRVRELHVADRFGVTIRTKEETERDRRIGLHEEQALLAASGQMGGAEHKYVGSAMHDRIIGALEACCRRGEMLRLQNRHVDWERHQIAFPVVMRRMRRIAAFHSTPKDAWRPSSSAARLSALTRMCSDRRLASSWPTSKRPGSRCS